MFERVRRLLLDRWTAAVCEHPVAILVIAGLLTAVGVAVTAQQLTFQADRNDLLSPSLEWNQRHQAYTDDFAGHHEVITAVRVPEGEDGPERARAFVDHLVGRLQGDEHVDRVWYRIETNPVLLRLLPMPEFRERLAELRQSQPLLEAENVSDLLARATASLSEAGEQEALSPEQAVAQIEQLGRLIAFIEHSLRGEAEQAEAEGVGLSEQQDWQYLTSEDDELLLVQIEPRGEEDELDPYENAVIAIREHLEATRAAFPAIEAGLTGIAVMEADEAAVLIEDSTLASIVAITAIVILLLVAFHGWRAPLLMVVALAVGVAWSFGALTLMVGHLQLLSVFFTVILLGLGIDYGIHLVSRFELIRHRFPDDRAGARRTLLDTMQRTGPGIITGAITTAVAFAVTLFTDFRGMAEMGLIAAVGVLLCMIAMLSVLPALLILIHERHKNVAAADVRAIDMHAQGWLMPVARRPGLTLAIAIAVVLPAALAVPRVDYDSNLMNLYPEGLESVEWQQVVMEHSREAVWSAVSITDDLSEARRRTRAFRQLAVVDSVGGIGMLFPPNEARKLALAAEVRAGLSSALAPPAEAEADDPPAADADRLHRQLNALAVGAAIGTDRPEVRDQPELRAALTRLAERARTALAVMEQPEFSDDADQHLQTLGRAFAELQRTTRRTVQQALSQRPLEVEDLPDFVLRRSVSQTEPRQYAIQLFPRQDVWEPEHMQTFAAGLRRVDPHVTGVPIQVYESGRLIRRSYVFVGLLAFGVVLVLVYVDFLRPVDALLCMVPVTLGFVMMFGFMYLAGVQINPANIIALPLLFGIGVASGVHIVHRYQQSRYARPLGLSAGTGKGVLLTNLTTIIAFASLMVASHRGIRGLGFVISIGVAMTLLACLTVLPALLELRNHYHVLKRRRQWQRARDASDGSDRSEPPEE